MRLYRVASEKPYVVEYCEIKGDSLQREPGVESVVRDEGKYLIILINKNFGKEFEKVELYPEKETNCPEPPFVGKYPNARSISCMERNKGISFVYVTKDKGHEIYEYYKERLKTHYKNVGFNFPERAWKFDDEFGMQINSSEPARVKIYLDPLRQDSSISAPPASTGVIFRIVITEIGLKPIIEEYSLIRISYSPDPERMNNNIDRMKRLYPGG